MFKLPTRFDDTIAESGIWIDAVDTLGRQYGKFRCALIDKHTPRWKLTLARMEKEQSLINKRNAILRQKGLPVEKSTENFAAVLFVELSLMDWEGVYKEDGTEAEFNKKDALQFFLMDETQFILEQLYEAASNIENFQPFDESLEEDIDALDAELAELSAEAEVEAEVQAKKTKKADESE